MSKRLRAAGGVIAIWDNASDDDPFYDPLNNLDRVKFHSGLSYPKVIDERTITVGFPARGSPGSPRYTQSYTLFAHGRPGIPLVFASALIGSDNVAFTGSIPVQLAAGWPYWARWVTVGADNTNVYAYEYLTRPFVTFSSTSVSTFAAINIPITVWVTDEDLS